MTTWALNALNCAYRNGPQLVKGALKAIILHTLWSGNILASYGPKGPRLPQMLLLQASFALAVLDRPPNQAQMLLASRWL